MRQAAGAEPPSQGKQRLTAAPEDAGTRGAFAAEEAATAQVGLVPGTSALGLL